MEDRLDPYYPDLQKMPLMLHTVEPQYLFQAPMDEQLLVGIGHGMLPMRTLCGRLGGQTLKAINDKAGQKRLG